MAAFAAAVVDGFDPLARASGVALKVDTDLGLEAVRSDPRRLRQIVTNLIVNALKYRRRDGEGCWVRVTFEVAPEGRWRIAIDDNGVGIAPDDLKRIGDPFFQAGKTYQRRHEGTGLGLSIVKSLVGLHGGDLRLHSKIGEGTTVTVVLPLACSKPEASQPVSNIATLAPATRSAAQEQTVQVKKSA